jgi:TRAP-type uncharacterized transport system fused permease subunit
MRRPGAPPLAGVSKEVVQTSSRGGAADAGVGSVAVVLLELTGAPCLHTIAAALLPALLYFLAVWVGVNTHVRHHDLEDIADEDKPSARAVLVPSAFFLVPFAMLMAGMFATGITPQHAVGMAILTAAVMLLVDDRLTFAWAGQRAGWRRYA